ncbi:MAG TPA: hypothetical protein VFH27_14370 [Longimicrobiaceae bacterium]|nr:hypothetical protein [Longimicrobiaceae bacterium]
MRITVRRWALAALCGVALTAGCAPRDADDAAPASRAPAPDTAPAPLPGTVSAGEWKALEPGAPGGITLAADGQVSAGGRAFAPRLPMKDAAGGAIRYRVSPPSPGARYAFVNGTAQGGTAMPYVADLRGARLVPTQVLKYGPAPWVAYASSQPYALLVSKQEGTTELFAVNLTDGTSRRVDLSSLAPKGRSAAADETSLRWKDGATFTLNAVIRCNPGLDDCRHDAGTTATRAVEVTLPAVEAKPLP